MSSSNKLVIHKNHQGNKSIHYYDITKSFGKVNYSLDKIKNKKDKKQIEVDTNTNINTNDRSIVVKKCLLIGINYTGSGNALNGCINDSENLKEFLLSKNYFKESDTVMMNDHKSGNLYPTKKNIMHHFNELVTFANTNKNKQVELFVSYSGHGYHIKDTNGDEEDGQDEVLCPIDFNTAGFIVDDYIRASFVDKLPANVKLIMFVDACHSGTMLDLKYAYKVNATHAYNVYGNYKDTACNVVSISGCRDNQTSADAYVKDDRENVMEYQGAMTASLIKNYHDGISYNELITKMRSWLISNKYAQVPQLTSGKLININDPFLLNEF